MDALFGIVVCVLVAMVVLFDVVSDLGLCLVGVVLRLIVITRRVGIPRSCSTREDALKSGGEVTSRLQALQMELDIKSSAIVNLSAELATMQSLAADLEEQLRNAGNASTVRQLERQLRQTVLVHRQLIRKVCQRAGMVGIEIMLVGWFALSSPGFVCTHTVRVVACNCPLLRSRLWIKNARTYRGHVALVV